MCSQAVPNFCMLLRENFSNSLAFTLINKYAKGAVVHISKAFGLVSMGLQKRDFLDIYLTTAFGVCNFQNTSGHLFMKMFKILSIFQKYRKKFRKSFSF